MGIGTVQKFFIRYKIINEDFISDKGTYVFVANHRSMLDIPLYARACSNTFRFLSKAELTKIPLLGYVIRKLYVTVKRGDKKTDKKYRGDAQNTGVGHFNIYLP